MPRNSAKTAPKKPTGSGLSRARQSATPFEEPDLDGIDWEQEDDDADDAEEKGGERRKSGPSDAQIQAALKQIQDKLSKPSASTTTRKKYLGAQSKALREHADQFVQESNAYIDQMLADADNMLHAMKREAETEDALARTKHSWDDVHASLGAIQDAKRPLVEELSPMRQQDIEAASLHFEMIEHARHAHLKRVLRNAKHEINGVIEEEQVAADASAWIRDLKKVLRC